MSCEREYDSDESRIDVRRDKKKERVVVNRVEIISMSGDIEREKERQREEESEGQRQRGANHGINISPCLVGGGRETEIR